MSFTERYAFIFLPVVAAFCGLWLGEHQAGPLPVRDLLAAVAIAAVTALSLWRVRRALAVSAAIGVVLIFGTTWTIGAREATQAFNACVQHGEQVRVALADYHAKQGRYPATLAELAVAVPGALRLPPHVLRYKRGSTGYTLWFADWLVQHEADESHAFVVHK